MRFCLAKSCLILSCLKPVTKAMSATPQLLRIPSCLSRIVSSWISNKHLGMFCASECILEPQPAPKTNAFTTRHSGSPWSRAVPRRDHASVAACAGPLAVSREGKDYQGRCGCLAHEPADGGGLHTQPRHQPIAERQRSDRNQG
jgi:hypothetical protein